VLDQKQDFLELAATCEEVANQIDDLRRAAERPLRDCGKSMRSANDFRQLPICTFAFGFLAPFRDLATTGIYLGGNSSNNLQSNGWQ